MKTNHSKKSGTSFKTAFVVQIALITAAGCNATVSDTSTTPSTALSATTYTVTPSAANATLNLNSAQTVSSGSAQAFTVTALTGYTLSTTVGGTCAAGSWSGSTYTTGAVIANCTAIFSASLITYAVTPSSTNSSSSPSTAQTVSSGATQAFTVTASSGYTLSYTVGGTCAAGSWSGGNIYTTGAVTANCIVTFSGTAITTRTVDANTTFASTVTTPYGATCSQVTRDTSSCQAARTALGLSGNWLLFSCNVVLGLATSGGVATTTYANATYVTLTFRDQPDYASNYYPTSGTYSFSAYGSTVTGNYSSLYSAYTTTFPNPSYIAQESMTASVPLVPSVSQTSTAGYGAVGVAVNGVEILDSAAANTDNIFAEAGSFDKCQGHPNNTGYHYHSEPYSISYNDNNLIGVMLDGYFIYGRKDNDGTTPTVGSSGNVFTYGGHVGSSPLSGTGSAFHYHVTQWSTCLDEYSISNTSYSYSDDGADTCTHMSAGSLTGTIVNGYFMTGHGSGGVFRTIPSGATNQTTTAVRYFYGTPGTCVGC